MSGLTLTQKIIAAHQIGTGPVDVGCTVQLAVDWVMASELALKGMVSTFDRLGNPDLVDPSRFYLAVDHTVDPVTVATDEKVGQLVKLSRDFAQTHKLTAFYDANETIMHTRFYRDHCLPGDIVVGADSHTTSHGAVGALAIGLGGADVAIAAVTGETWLEVPEAILVNYTGKPAFGVTGKDIILRTMGVLGRNTVALERSVEYRAEHLDSLSTDTRFTICNMTAEFGGVNGIFEPSSETLEFLDYRARGTDAARLFQADADAEYADQFQIDLAGLPPQVAKPFSPDNVADVTDYAGTALDGCFIGSCTTTEEELILAGLVLDAMWTSGLRPRKETRRLMVPGDLEIARKLDDLGLTAIYERAGFRVGVPGCHLCLGLGSEKAGDGETWLSSQNRNYHNRMGKGSMAWLASAATVSASSQDMQITDPRPFLGQIDQTRFAQMLGRTTDPAPVSSVQMDKLRATVALAPSEPGPTVSDPTNTVEFGPLEGRVQLFGDNIDTDAIIPGEFCSITDWTQLGKHSFAHVRPEFPTRCAAGQTIIVAGDAWGTGSAREHAAWCLIGSGVKLVIARSFAVVHRRNLINEGLPTLTLSDPAFFELIREDDHITADLTTGQVTHTKSGHIFQGQVPSGIAAEILAGGGITKMIMTASSEETP